MIDKQPLYTWEQIEVAELLVKDLLIGSVVDREYYFSLVSETLEYNIDLVNKIIEERKGK